MIFKLFILAQLVVASLAVPDATDMPAVPILRETENVLSPGGWPSDLYNNDILPVDVLKLYDTEPLSNNLDTHP